MSLCIWVVRSVLRVFVGFWGGSFQKLFPYFCPSEPPAQCRARVRVKRRYLRRRAVAFSPLFNFALPTPSSSQNPASDQGTLFARNVVQGYVRVCVSYFIFCVLHLFYFVFSTKHSPPSRGCRYCHLPSRVFVVSSSNPLPCRWPAGGFSHDFSLVLAPVFPSISTRARLAIVPFLWLVCRRAFPAPPHHTGGLRQVLEPFLPSPATPAARGRFFTDGFALL